MRPVAIFLTLAASLVGCGLLQSSPHLAQALPSSYPSAVSSASCGRSKSMAIWRSSGRGPRVTSRLLSIRGSALPFPSWQLRRAWQALWIALANHGREAVVVPWHLVSLTGPDTVSRRVARPDGPLVERVAAMGSISIPPGGAFEDYVFPAG